MAVERVDTASEVVGRLGTTNCGSVNARYWGMRARIQVSLMTDAMVEVEVVGCCMMCCC